jgi:hypothetical protein
MGVKALFKGPAKLFSAGRMGAGILMRCAIRSLGGGRDYCGADDLAVYFFVLRGFDIGFVVVDLIVDGAAYDEVCGVHGVARIGAAGVRLSLGVEGEVIALMLVLLVLGAVRLVVFQGGVSLDLVGEGWKSGEEYDGKDRE